MERTEAILISHMYGQQYFILAIVWLNAQRPKMQPVGDRGHRPFLASHQWLYRTWIIERENPVYIVTAALSVRGKASGGSIQFFLDHT